MFRILFRKPTKEDPWPLSRQGEIVFIGFVIVQWVLGMLFWPAYRALLPKYWTPWTTAYIVAGLIVLAFQERRRIYRWFMKR